MTSDRPLADLRFLMFVGDDYEDLELWYPKIRLEEEGALEEVARLAESKTISGIKYAVVRPDPALLPPLAACA